MRPKNLTTRRTDPDPDVAATFGLVIAIGRSYRAIEEGVRPHLAERGLSMTEFAVLEVLLHKGPLPLSEIRDRILVTGASTTYVMNRLEERELVRRRPCEEDQRVVFGELTPHGRKVIRSVFPAHVDQLLDVTAGLSTADKKRAATLLRPLAERRNAPNDID